MSAGLPGFGLGGVFFILCALVVAPAVEIVRTMRGRSSVAAWRVVSRQFAMALAMVVMIDLTLRATALLPGIPDSGVSQGLTGPALEPIAISVAALAVLLIAAKLVAIALKPRRPLRRSPVARKVYRAGRRLVFERGS